MLLLLLQLQSASPMQLQLNNDQMRWKGARDEAHISLQSINPILCSVYIGEYPSPSRRPATLLQPAKVHNISYLHIKRISTKSTCTQSFPPRSDGFWAGALLSTLRTRELIPKNPIPNRCLQQSAQFRSILGWCINSSSSSIKQARTETSGRTRRTLPVPFLPGGA